jgi:hypothetical protein
MKRMLPVALLGLALAGIPLYGDQSARPAQPGAINYVEGTAFLDGNQLSPQSVGSTGMDAGQVLTTEQGKAEVLLTPGVFMRVGDNSAVKMISPDITPTRVEVDRGRMALEVDELHKENNLEIATAGVTTRIAKTGYYEFDADQASVKVFKGEAAVDRGDGKSQTVKGNHEMAFAEGTAEKPTKFNADNSADELYNWSSLRSKYLAEANQQMAGEYAGAGYYPGWYWNPYIYGYTYLGAYPFMSPFGWGFYPLGWGGYYGGYYHGPYRGYSGPVGHYGGVINPGLVGGGGFHGGFAGGGFGGGFHGGGGHR